VVSTDSGAGEWACVDRPSLADALVPTRRRGAWRRMVACWVGALAASGATAIELEGDPFLQVRRDLGFQEHRIDEATVARLAVPVVAPPGDGLLQRAELPDAGWKLTVVGNRLRLTDPRGKVQQMLDADQGDAGVVEGFRLMKGGWLFVQGSETGYVAETRRTSGGPRFDLRPLAPNLFRESCFWFSAWARRCRPARAVYIESLDRVVVGGYPPGFLTTVQSHEFQAGRLTPLQAGVSANQLPRNAGTARGVMLEVAGGGLVFYDGTRYEPFTHPYMQALWVFRFDTSGRRILLWPAGQLPAYPQPSGVDDLTVVPLAFADGSSSEVEWLDWNPGDGRWTAVTPKTLLWQRDARMEAIVWLAPGFETAGGGRMSDGSWYLRVRGTRDGAQAVFRIHRDRSASPRELSVEAFRSVRTDLGFSARRIDPATFERLRDHAWPPPPENGLLSHVAVPGTPLTAMIEGDRLRIRDAAGAVVEERRLMKGGAVGLRPLGEGWLFVQDGDDRHLLNLGQPRPNGRFERRAAAPNLFRRPCARLGLLDCRDARAVYVPRWDKVVVLGYRRTWFGNDSPRWFEVERGRLVPLDARLGSTDEDDELSRHPVFVGHDGGRYHIEGATVRTLVPEGTGESWFKSTDFDQRRSFLVKRSKHGAREFMEIHDTGPPSRLAMPDDLTVLFPRLYDDPADHQLIAFGAQGVLLQRGARFEWVVRLSADARYVDSGRLLDGDYWMRVKRVRDGSQSVYRIQRRPG